MGYSFKWILEHISQSFQTGSYSLTAGSASYAGTASYITGSIFTSTNPALSASYALSSSYTTTASYITSSNVYGPYGSNSILSSSYAVTASYALNGGTGGGGTPGGVNTSIQFNSGGYFSGSTRFTFNSSSNAVTLTGSIYVSGAISASYGASTVGFYGTSSWAINALTASYVLVESIWERSAGTQSAVLVAPNKSTANETGSVAFGYTTTADGDYSFAHGKNTAAYGQYTHAEGVDTTSGGRIPIYAYTSQSLTETSITVSYDDGGVWDIGGNNSYVGVIGVTNINWLTYFNNGLNSYFYVTANGPSGTESYRIGQIYDDTLGTGYYYLRDYDAVGANYYDHTSATGSTTNPLSINGNPITSQTVIGYTRYGSGSHAEGYSTTANGDYSHAEGRSTIASGSYTHAEGYNTIASGSYTHAEGHCTTVVGTYSHAEGSSSLTYGSASHAEGHTAATYGPASHAEGYSALSYGYAAHGEGSSTYAGIPYGYKAIDYDTSHSDIRIKIAENWWLPQTYNPQIGDYVYLEYDSAMGAEIDDLLYNINNSRNATLTSYTWDGVYTQITMSGAPGIILGTYGSVTIFPIPFGPYTLPYIGLSYDPWGYDDPWIGSEFQAANVGNYSHAEGVRNWTIGKASHAEGYYNMTIGQYSHAEGAFNLTFNNGAHAEGYRTKAIGFFDHSEGNYTIAQGSYSHAEGNYTTTNNTYAHAEGSYTNATGVGSHTEGSYTTSSGNYSHAEGSSSIAYGIASHAGGLHTIASGSYQTTIGTYNQHNNTSDLFVVGGGTDNANRHDVLNVGISNVRVTGSLFISGSTTADPMSVKAGSQQALSVSSSGVVVLGQFGSTPPAVAGGIYFDGTDFYLGFP